MIASFSRALLSDLRAQQSDEEFDRTLGTAIDEIYQASTAEGAGLTVDEDEFDPIDFPAPASGPSRRALPDQPARRWRRISRSAEGRAGAGHRFGVSAARQGRERA